MNKNIAVIFGGTSSEYEISLQSATAVLKNFPRKYNAVPIWITREGEWLYFWGNVLQISGSKPIGSYEKAIISPDRKDKCLISGNLKINLDAVFPIMHGTGGEDGTVQGLAELAGLPICGCGVLASAIGMDKDRAHKLVSTAGISVPKAETFSDILEIIPEKIMSDIGLPVFVKPLRGGSSCGISRVDNINELIRAAENAFKFDNEIIVEQEIKGVEVGCAIIGTRELIVGEVDEIKLADRFFDFCEKYTPKTSQIICPAPISRKLSDEIKSTAKTIYKTLGCCGFARVDMFLTDNGGIFFNEVNTIPGFTEHSRFPSMMRAAGYSFEKVIELIIDTAVNQ